MYEYIPIVMYKAPAASLTAASKGLSNITLKKHKYGWVYFVSGPSGPGLQGDRPFGKDRKG